MYLDSFSMHFQQLYYCGSILVENITNVFCVIYLTNSNLCEQFFLNKQHFIIGYQSKGYIFKRL